MKVTAALLISILLLSACAPEPADVPVPDVVDQLTGSSWIRPGFKSPINGKNVYYYFTFKKNKQIDSYVKLDRVEMQTEPPETGSYTADTTSKEPVIVDLKITFKELDYAAVIQSNKLTFKTKNGEFTYYRE